MYSPCEIGNNAPRAKKHLQIMIIKLKLTYLKKSALFTHSLCAHTQLNFIADFCKLLLAN